MDTAFVFELIGYLASILVAVSLMMRSVLRLRLINLAGALIFTVYGLLIQAYPVAFMNFLIVLINVYYLVGMVRAHEYFELLEVEPDSAYLQHFLQFYADDIQSLIPDFNYDAEDHDVALLVLRNMVPAGVFLAQRFDDDTLFVTLDYVIPGYRDLKSGRFIYGEKAGYFTEKGYSRMVTFPGSKIHRGYLERIGFVAGQAPQRSAVYERVLS